MTTNVASTNVSGNAVASTSIAARPDVTPIRRAPAPSPSPATPSAGEAAPTGAVEALLRASTHAVPGVGHVSISLLERGGAVRTLAATGEVARQLDELQFALHQGPSVDALHSHDPLVGLHAGCPEDLARWPEVMARAVSSGLFGVLSVRMVWEAKTVGVLTLGSEQQGCFPRETVLLASSFAAHAAATVGLARKAERLELAMVARQEIGQAVGILMERYGMTADAAFAYLRRLSQTTNVKLRVVADQLRLTGRLPGEGLPAAGAAAHSAGGPGAHPT
ncbi:ANTAR domain-containing protein [Terrabacter sp. BE26]|uniref:ANTAR domain-containing protein n=1 Tax=Terrabacter sp. BE26 TaxID=2898152 RepID=UPI0035BE4C10